MLVTKYLDRYISRLIVVVNTLKCTYAVNDTYVPGRFTDLDVKDLTIPMFPSA